MVVNRKSENTRCVNIGADNIGGEAAQLVVESGSMVAINVMRYNGYSYEHTGGDFEVYNRITINNKGEESVY